MATATAPGGSKTKNLAASSLKTDAIYIRWHKSHHNKVTAGDQRFRVYKDKVTGEMRRLVDPHTGKEKVFVVFAYKDFKLNVATNPWHKAVYEFILGSTEPGGPWRGHERFNPRRKLLYLVNATEEAKKNTATRKEIREMEMAVEAMSPERLLLFGALFGAEGKDMTYDDVLNAVVDLIHTPAHTEGMLFSVKDVQEKLQSKDLDYWLVVAAMQKKQILKFDNGVYKFENAGIGMDLHTVVQWLKDQKGIYSSLSAKLLPNDVAADSGSD